MRTFVLTLAHYVEASGLCSDGPITTAALEAAATSERVREACRILERRGGRASTWSRKRWKRVIRLWHSLEGDRHDAKEN